MSSQQSLVSIIKPTFKSQIHIIDPYLCGDGSYGNVLNSNQFGVDNVYYDFYDTKSNGSPAYSFKLKLNSNGDFFLPISGTTNKIAEGNYRVVFYAVDQDGGRAQGEYKAFITNNCSLYNNTINKLDSIRTGGLSMASIIIALIILASFGYSYQKSKSKKLVYEAKNTDEF